MARAVKKRKDLAWYTDFCMHASVSGAKITRSFYEIFPEYAPDGEREEAVAVSPETATLLERLAVEQKARLEARYGERKRTTDKN